MGYNNNMDTNIYNKAVELLKAELIESATEMKLDVEWYKNNVLNDEYCLALMQNDIAAKMIEVAV